MPLKPGTLTDYSGSMAEAMEHAFRNIWPSVMGTGYPEINDHMRMVFISIAQGVVRHLADNANSFQVTVQDEQGHIHPIIPMPPYDANYYGSSNGGSGYYNDELQHTHTPFGGEKHTHGTSVTITEV